MSIADEDLPRRRDPDDTVLPVVMLKVEERLREDRHTFRNELATIGAKQEAAQAQASAEHAVLRADVAKLQHCVEPIPKLTQTVERLDEAGVFQKGHDAGLADVTKAIRWGIGILVAFIGAMTGVLALLMHS